MLAKHLSLPVPRIVLQLWKDGELQGLDWMTSKCLLWSSSDLSFHDWVFQSGQWVVPLLAVSLTAPGFCKLAACLAWGGFEEESLQTKVWFFGCIWGRQPEDFSELRNLGVAPYLEEGEDRYGRIPPSEDHCPFPPVQPSLEETGCLQVL